MKKKVLLPVMCLMLASAATAQKALQVKAITEVFGDGQQVTAVAVKYDKQMDGKKLAPAMFSVDEIVPPQLRPKGRTIPTDPVVEAREVAKVYTNDVPEMAAASKKGQYVILELVKTYHYLPAFNPPGQRGGNDAKKDGKKDDMKKGDGNGGPIAGGRPRPAMPLRAKILESYKGVTKIADFKAEVKQLKAIKAADGSKIAPFSKVSDEVENLIVDDFIQKEYYDRLSGIKMIYNLFVPKNYDPTKKYPLVLFMPDATVTGMETTRTLTQGIGATIWASPEEQAKHPCFVLAPDYTQQIINDDWETNEYMDATVNLIRDLQKEYSINANKMYTTGQSGGCMLSFAMDHKYPDLFAASLLMAGKWDPTRVENFKNAKMWMFCGKGDLGAFPSMNSITSELEKMGVKVSKAVWNGRSTQEEFNRLGAEMDKEGANIRYVMFPQYTVFPDDDHIDGMEHLQTWRVSYTIECARDWLFRQSK